MADQKVSKAQMWMIFLASLVACIAFLLLLPAWFWITLPFLLTSLVYALDVA